MRFIQSICSSRDCMVIHILFGLLIFGHLKLGVLAQSVNDNYDIYNDDEESPGEQIKTTLSDTKSTMMPYFESNSKTIFVQLGTRIVLDCPIKNYDESKQQVLWFKDGKPITNGQELLGKAYQIDRSFNLTVEQVTEETSGIYYCSVMPQNIKRYVTVNIGEIPIETVTKSTPKAKDENANNAQMLLPKSTISLLLIFIVFQNFSCQHLI